MRATLLYNPKSGTAEDERRLVDAFAEVGWKVERCVHKKNLEDCMCDPGDVVIVAGGDGTVGKVAKRLAGTNVPMAIVPTGTANNVARSLGIGVDPKIAITGLSRATERVVDIGMVKSAAGSEAFLEGFGVGVFAYTIGEKATRKHKKLRRALTLIADVLEDYKPRRFDIHVDGVDLSGEYLLAAVMNVKSFGPALGLAPEAKVDDGLLDVVLVRPEHKEALIAHLRRAAVEGDVALPAFETHHARRVQVRADGRWAHVDDRPRELEGDVKIDIAAGAVRVLVPS